MTISAEFIDGVVVGFIAAFIVMLLFQLGMDWQREHPDPKEPKR